MANTNLTIDMITREALRVAHEKCSFLGTIDRQYDKSFTGSPKHGATLRIREPNQYTRRQGSRVMDIQDTTTTAKTLTVATQDGVDMRFNSEELALDIEDFSKRHIEPAMAVLVSGIEADVLSSVTKSVYQQVGTPGTVPGTSGDYSAVYDARTKLNQSLAPKDGMRRIQLGSREMGEISYAAKGLFQDSTQIKEAFREGFISRSAMADWYENERIYTHTNGSSDNTGTVNDTVADGDAVVTLASMGANGTITAGSVITFAGCYDVHPETKVAYSHLKQFVVTADVTASAGEAVTVAISPTIHTTGANKNCSAIPTDSGAALISGSASTAYAQSLMYHKEAFAFVTADLPIMDDASKCVRRVQDNISMRCWEASDIVNDQRLTRIDILYGYLATRPEWACRITS